jgi:PKD repeat protein
MQQLSGIYTRNKMGIDNRVWFTLLITVLLSAGLFGFKIATTEPCFDVKLTLKGVVEHPFTNNYFVGESIIFNAEMKKGQKVTWDFGDGTAPGSGTKVTHSFNREGNFLVTATVNGKCMQSVNVHISQVDMPAPAAVQPADPNSIIGKDFAAAGELAIFQTGAAASAYEWTIEGNDVFAPKSGNKVSYSFTDPGTYIVKLKLDNDEAKVYRKTVTVSMNPADAKGAGPDDLPPLPLPALPKESGPGGNTAVQSGGEEKEASASEKKVELIPDPILKNQLQDVIEGKESLENLSKYMCDGMNGKVKGNGRIYASLSLFGEELKGKKGMLGLGGKKKIKSVRANREVGSNCIFRLDVEYK